MFAELLAVILQALTRKTVDFEGEFFRYKDVPFEIWPFQKPHPPLWYGVVNPDSAGTCGEGRHELHQQSDRTDGEGQGRALHRRAQGGSRASRRRNSE